MKKHLAIVAAFALLFTGCSTLNPTTGQKEFDEAKTAAVLVPLQTGIAYAVKMGAEGDVNTGVALRIGEQVITNLLATEGPIERDTILARVWEIEIAGWTEEQRTQSVGVLANLVLDYYDILVAYVFRQGLSPDNPDDTIKATRMVLETIRDGINLGLMSAAAPQP